MPRTSTKQAEILEFLKESLATNGYAPSVREICSAVGLRSTASVHYHLNELKRQGLIEMDENKNRTITLPDADPSKSGRIPIVGVVTAGHPILAIENIDCYLPWDGDDSCFALRVRGESMKDAGIYDGDTVVVRPQPTATQGDIVVAMLGEEATVKRFHLDGQQIWLMPENPAFEPIDGSDAVILGKVKALVRDY